MKLLKTIQLTNKWVILVISSIDDVIDEIERLSGNTFKVDIERWKATKDTTRPDWTTRKRMFETRDKYIAEARLNIGEQDLDLKETYSSNVLNIGRCIVSVDDNKTIGGPPLEYVHYCYVEVPENTKQITCKNVVADIDLNSNNISRAIKINQVGYTPKANKKYAYIGAHIYEYGPLVIDSTSFDIFDSITNEKVFSGPITLRDANYRLPNGRLCTGENVYELDITNFTNVGTFYIKVDGVGKSWDFKNNSDVFGELFYTYMRGLYHQRCGIELRTPFTKWPRIKCHTKPVLESKYVSFPNQFIDRPAGYERFDVYGASLDTSSFTTNIFGGWHDAADWDRNTQHYTCIFDMLYAYEMNPTKFKRNQLNIPESADLLPDILNEINYGLMIWKRSMTSTGGVSGAVETNTHPAIEVDGNFGFSIRTRWDSLLFSAASAMMAQFTKEFDPAASERWLWYATKSYNFGNNPNNSLGTIKIPAKHNRGTGAYYEYTFTETDNHILPLLAHAKVRLYEATGDKIYLDKLPEMVSKLPNPVKWPYTNKDYSQWINYSVLRTLSEADKAIYTKKWFLDYANLSVEKHKTMPYRCTWNKDQGGWLSWGSSNTVNENRMLIIAYVLTKNTKYMEPVYLNHDFMLGANAMGMSWTTGLGQTYPIAIQHDVSRLDNIDDPVPGVTIYGITGGTYLVLRTQGWRSPKPDGTYQDFKVSDVPVWRSWGAHTVSATAQCEFTVQETFSSMIFSSAFLMPDNWLPSEELKKKGPKPKSELHGYYYLP